MKLATILIKKYLVFFFVVGRGARQCWLLLLLLLASLIAMEEMFQNHNEGRGGRGGWEKSASALSTAASAMEESCSGDDFRGELPRDRRLWP